MEFLKSEQRVRNGYFGAFALLILIYSFVFLSMLQMGKRFSGINSGYNVIWNLKLLSAQLNTAENTFIEYSPGNKLAYIDSITAIENRVDSLMLVLKMLAPEKEKRTDSLRHYIQSRFDFYQTYVESSSPADSLLPKNRKILAAQNVLKNDIRHTINTMEASEKVVFNKGSYSLSNMSGFFITINVVGFLLSLILGIYAFNIYNKENYAKRIYRRQLEEGIEQLKGTNRQLDELRSIEKFAVSGRISRTIAHEIRNPLTNINLACEQINISPNHDSYPLLEMIKRNSKRINDLITDLLNSTKFTELNSQKIYIQTVLDQALAFAGDRINLHGITIVKDYGIPRKVEVDAEKMKIAFLNIIINAIEAMEPGKGILEIKVINKQEHCQVIIKDNGSGMDKESILRIFEPYFTSKSEGNGLGLTHTQNIILNHNGKINVSSTPGIGTSFSIEINYEMVHQFEQNGYT
jgi:signal transduction histidine kinase